MKIGIDIDDTVARFSEKYVASSLHLDREQGDKGFLNKKVFVSRGMFDWSEQQFRKNDIITVSRIIDNLRAVKNARRVVNQLKSDGHKIFFITARGFDGCATHRQSLVWLRNNGFKYDKLITHKKFKLETLKKYKIDLMIEDCIASAEQFSEGGIPTILLKDYWNANEKTSVKKFDGWTEIYAHLSSSSGLAELPIILDTDTCNEVDDEFAIGYILKQNLNVEAITIAPNYFFTEKGMDIAKNCERSFKKTIQLCKLTGTKPDKVFLGSTGFMEYGFNENSEAVEKIIEICKRNPLTVFVEIGAPTNLALALKKCPEIAKKIKVLLLGGRFNKPENSEYNYAQDLAATNFILSLGLDLTIFPAGGVTELLTASMPYLAEKLSPSPLNKQLIKDFAQTINNYNLEQKSFFDVCPIAFVHQPMWFDLEEVRFKVLKTRPKFGKGRLKAKLVTGINADEILKHLIKILNGEKNEN